MTKNIGITRRIDELGRIVVPKEIRYNLGIRDGEPLEIYTDDDSIIIKKYSQVENIKEISQTICDIVSDVGSVDILITDREKIVVASNNLKDLINLPLNEEHKELIDNRETYLGSNKETIYNKTGFFTILPIITQADCSGLVILLSNQTDEKNILIAKIIQRLLVHKLDVN